MEEKVRIKEPWVLFNVIAAVVCSMIYAWYVLCRLGLSSPLLTPPFRAILIGFTLIGLLVTLNTFLILDIIEYINKKE